MWEGQTLELGHPWKRQPSYLLYMKPTYICLCDSVTGRAFTVTHYWIIFQPLGRVTCFLGVMGLRAVVIIGHCDRIWECTGHENLPCCQKRSLCLSSYRKSLVLSLPILPLVGSILIFPTHPPPGKKNLYIDLYI